MRIKISAESTIDLPKELLELEEREENPPLLKIPPVGL